jgi:hypothetical protein
VLWVTGSGGSVIWSDCPGLEVLGHLTLTLLGPAWTVNSLPGLTPAGTVTRYTCAGPVAVLVTAKAPGRVVSGPRAATAAEGGAADACELGRVKPAAAVAGCGGVTLDPLRITLGSAVADSGGMLVL